MHKAAMNSHNVLREDILRILLLNSDITSRRFFRPTLLDTVIAVCSRCAKEGYIELEPT